MAISFVGSASNSTFNGGSITLSLTGLLSPTGATVAPQPGDLAVVTHTIGATADRVMATSSSGWTKQSDLFADGTTNDTNHAVFTKVMGASPDASVVLTGNASTASACSAVVEVFRGCDSTTFLDAAVATDTGTGTGRPNPPAVTPSTPGAWIVCCGSAAAATGALFTNHGDLSSAANAFRSKTDADTIDATTAMGHKTDWASGTFDPAQWGGGTANAGDSWAATVLVLRPAQQTVYVGAAGQSARYAGSRIEAQLYVGALRIWP